MSAESRPASVSAVHGSGWNVAAACIEPLYNLSVTANEVVLTVDLPFVNPKRVRLECPSDDILEIYAGTSRKITFKELGVKHRHGEFTCYHVRVRVPVSVNEKKMTSKLKRGMLEVHVPRLK